MKNYLGEHQENNLGSREKRVKFQREPGAGDPLTEAQLQYWWILLLIKPQYKNAT